MHPFLRAVLMPTLAVASFGANAMYHLWQMNEIYSSADGSVQYLEMTAIAGQQQYLTGHSLVSRSGGMSRTFSFPADLPGETTGVRMLIATQGFAALGVVTPDYIVPNGFFFQAGGSLDFAGVDLWTFGPLPTDGRSLHRDGTRAAPSPLNFHGATGTLAGPRLQSYQGLWWRSPAGSEPGWGLSLAQEGDVIFAAWFTYDGDGRQMWLVAPEARLTAPNTYSGRLYRTTGPAFSATPWTPSAVSITDVGSATFTFTDFDSGVFAYSVGAVSQQRAIARQRLGG